MAYNLPIDLFIYETRGCRCLGGQWICRNPSNQPRFAQNPLFIPTTLFITPPSFQLPLNSSTPLFLFFLSATLSNMDSNFHGMTATSTRRTAFVEEDEGLASLVEMEAGFSGKNAFFSMSSRRRGSYKTFPPSSASSHSSSRSGLAYEETHYFLDSCHLCKKPLGGNRDIFMYRLDFLNHLFFFFLL